ncbi:hypothetical protein [Chitinolyticbacter albus]|uniref:hypothetical protein n=1 Tax=Chitinolyticbacter albus TaxID=2961951 RepID=UPI002109B2FC|nr:hypothetical protein [Chitinolyticbacter albus]
MAGQPMPTAQIELQSTIASTPRHSWTFDWPSIELTARELIRQATLERCRQYAPAQPQHDATLSQEAIAALAEQGRIALPARELTSVPDPEEEVQFALAAFTGRRFLLLAGQRQIRELDEVVTLSPLAPLVFIRLIPLQGG